MLAVSVATTVHSALVFEREKDTGHGHNKHGRFFSSSPLVTMVMGLLCVVCVFRDLDGSCVPPPCGDKSESAVRALSFSPGL